ncbi:Highly acidic protein [Campylobacter concisus]|uniref:Highly acidic protein n=1 Tax=Campylobacter concisus TaxID=199 RepID=UPI000D399B08|nr:Highly acidic protein [Campylobacter concisus]
MKVALVNKNPAVSRLITLSLNKLGIEYSEFDDVNSVGDQFDYIIIDSDMDSSDVNLNQKIMYLAPRGGEKPDFADVMLEKPFLPTEFISLFEQNKDTDNDKELELGLDEPTNFNDFDESNKNFDDLENFELPEIDMGLENLVKEDDEADKFDNEALDDEFLKEELSELEAEDLKDKDISFDERDTELIDDDMINDIASKYMADSEDLDKSLEQNNELPVIKEEHSDNFDELSSLVDEIDDMGESDLADEEAKNELDKMVEQNSRNLETAELNEDFVDDISQSKKELSEIESLDKELNEEASEDSENFDELETDFGNDENFEPESSEANLIDEASQNLEEDIDEESTKEAEEISLDEDIDLEKEPAKEDHEEISEEVLAQEDLGMVDEVFEEENFKEETLGSPNFDVASIEEIDENTMQAAFGLNNAPQTSSYDETKIDADYKEELTKKITKHVHESLNESSLRDVLKDMNIKINISFEEK